jgi:ribonucleotide reductase alpha subunit
MSPSLSASPHENAEFSGESHTDESIEKIYGSFDPYEPAPPLCVELSEADRAAIGVLLEGGTTALPFTRNALTVVAQRYLARAPVTGRLLETPEQMFARVAHALANVETALYGASEEARAAHEAEFYGAMTRFEFMPAGRTLANCGAATRLTSNCVVLNIEDSMESIFGTLRDAALLQKAGSGIGFPLHLMRPAGDSTVSSFGSSSGPISFLRVYNAAFSVVKQQGRSGANMAVMSVSARHDAVISRANVWISKILGA